MAEIAFVRLAEVINRKQDMRCLLYTSGVNLLISLLQNLPTVITTIVAAIPQIISSLVNAILNSIPQICLLYTSYGVCDDEEGVT